MNYDVTVIGAGASGSALTYILSKYTNIPKVLLLEKYESPGLVNSYSHNNSQTLHIGDIETNYNLEKATQVKPGALMVPLYAKSLSVEERGTFLFPTQKIILAVGDTEVAELEQRFTEFGQLFPDLKRADRIKLAEIEPAIINERSEAEPVLGLYTTGYALDFQKLAESFVNKLDKARITTKFDTKVEKLTKTKDGYEVKTNKGNFNTKVLIVNTDSYSLLFAQSLGYGKEYSLIPVGGNFYFSGKTLRGKVYTMQDQKLPFAAVHGDPDISLADENTRWGPTAKVFPVLESRNLKTTFDYFKSSGLWKPGAWLSFVKILTDPVRLKFLSKNLLYDIPFIHKYFFVKNIQKIAPAVKAKDIRKAKGFGGMRLQRVNIKTKELELGEGKIIGDNAIFNMTPSPGASVCLYNGYRDAQTITDFFDGQYTFDKAQAKTDLLD